jgi:CheY-like chemotaxis protein
MMPGMDGWEVARLIKNHPDYKDVTKDFAPVRMTTS